MDINYWTFTHLKASCLNGSCSITPPCVWAGTPRTHRLWTSWRRWTTSTACWAPRWRTTAKGRYSCRWMKHLWTCLQFWRWNEIYQDDRASWGASERSGSTASCLVWLSCSSSWLHTFWLGTKRASSSPLHPTTSAAWSVQDLWPLTSLQSRTTYISKWWSSPSHPRWSFGAVDSFQSLNHSLRESLMWVSKLLCLLYPI